MSVLAWPEATWLPSSGWDGAHVSLVWSYVPASRHRFYLNCASFHLRLVRAPPPPSHLNQQRCMLSLMYPLPPPRPPLLLPLPARVAGCGEVAPAEGTGRQRWVCSVHPTSASLFLLARAHSPHPATRAPIHPYLLPAVARRPSLLFTPRSRNGVNHSRAPRSSARSLQF